MDARDEMNTTSGSVKLTYDDFVHFPDDGKRHELIDGEHYVTPAPRPKHQVIVGNLYLVIASWLEAHPVGRLFLSPLDVVISEFDVVEPDLLFVSSARLEILTIENVRGTPDLVIEVASKSTRKRDRPSRSSSINGPAFRSTGWSIPRSPSSASIAARDCRSCILSSCPASTPTSCAARSFPASRFRSSACSGTRKPIPPCLPSHSTAVASISIKASGWNNDAMPRRVPAGWMPAACSRLPSVSAAPKNAGTSVV